MADNLGPKSSRCGEQNELPQPPERELVMSNDQSYPWFNLENYRRRNEFGFDGWKEMLDRRAGFEADFIRQQSLPIEDRNGFVGENFDREAWPLYLGQVLPCHYETTAGNVESPTSRFPIEDVTRLSVPDENGVRPIGQWSLEHSPIRLLSVDPRVPEEVLCEAFEKWLRGVREIMPRPVTRRGRPTLNIRIDQNHLRSWSQYNILAVFDLDLYDKAKGLRLLTNEALGKLLGSSAYGNPEEWGREARAKTTEAFECLELLTAQIESGMN
jgi:hypothetical protein